MTSKALFEQLQKVQVTPFICDSMLSQMEEFLTPVVEHYGVTISDLRMELRKEICAAKITVEEAMQAIRFLISNCEETKEECEETLHQEVCKCILYSGIYFTNVKPTLDNGEKIPGVSLEKPAATPVTMQQAVDQTSNVPAGSDEVKMMPDQSKGIYVGLDVPKDIPPVDEFMQVRNGLYQDDVQSDTDTRADEDTLPDSSVGTSESEFEMDEDTDSMPTNSDQPVEESQPVADQSVSEPIEKKKKSWFTDLTGIGKNKDKDKEPVVVDTTVHADQLPEGDFMRDYLKQ